MSTKWPWPFDNIDEKIDLDDNTDWEDEGEKPWPDPDDDLGSCLGITAVVFLGFVMFMTFVGLVVVVAVKLA